MLKPMMKELFRSDRTIFQLVRYTFVGGIAFCVDFGSLYFFTEFFDVYYLHSAVVAFLLGLVTNYVMSVKFVFHKRRVKNFKLEFGIFGLIGVIGLSLNEFIIWFGTEQLALYYLSSKIVATIVVYIWNFFIRKYTLFS
ncbi:GtrA family protein [Candidatus Peregrinibacteria bacterium]|nr:GtrA family protein [Candidatus Peregrinibacteria bacterium]